MTTPRRAMGALETEVMEILWATDAPMTPAQVLDALDGDLAYTTVMTILTRLWEKGLADRVKASRAYTYVAAVTEAELVASRMQRELHRSSDREATMSRFVSGLDPADARRLIALLEQTET